MVGSTGEAGVERLCDHGALGRGDDALFQSEPADGVAHLEPSSEPLT